MELEFAKMQQPREYFSFVGQRSNSMNALALEATDPLDRVTTLLEFEAFKILLIYKLGEIFVHCPKTKTCPSGLNIPAYKTPQN